MNICRICGGTHTTVNHFDNDRTHLAGETRNLTDKEKGALWDAARKSTKLIRKGRFIDT